ncbi:hypothetical protein QFC22_006213 [Naganishia vaughanmartiniae]|uniref:Uncharacterized protein n=1 Tax=Naganishia vaughanmartiniae TaxID=1424756 RepID=A0ACC2WNP6_9TREE|nr:hypothetical protein QFC22_006213 [Naganishia vaughanmartiniae]
MKNITPKDCVVRVSSTLDSSSGKKNLLDGSDETCWSSAQGLPQTVRLSWNELIPATHFAITFQGGFSATAVSVYVAAVRPAKYVDNITLGMVLGGKVYPKDSNGRQVFELPIPEAFPDSVHDEEHPLSPTLSGTAALPVHPADPNDDRQWIKELKLEFEKSADPWGRIVVYHIELLQA